MFVVVFGVVTWPFLVLILTYWPIFILAALAVAFCLSAHRKRRKRETEKERSGERERVPAALPRPDKRTDNGAWRELLLDCRISERDMLDTAQELFLKICYGWTNKDLSAVRAELSPGLFNQMSMDLDRYYQSGRTNVIENISVLERYITNFEVKSGGEFLTVRLVVREKNYLLDDKLCEAFLRGGNNYYSAQSDFYTLTYDYVFVRRVKVWKLGAIRAVEQNSEFSGQK